MRNYGDTLLKKVVLGGVLKASFVGAFQVVIIWELYFLELR